MPKQRISKTLIIGLGGTGNLALKYAKKRYWETYGKPNDISFSNFWKTGKFPLVDFLALDTDLKDLKAGIDEKNQISAGGEFKLSADEYSYLKVSDARSVIKDNPYIRRNWMPDNMVEQCDEISHGAGQFRAFGRLALTYHIENIKKRIKDKIDSIHRFENSQNQDYEAASADINICFCFSISGGTGAGMFMDIAFIAKEVLEDMNVSYCTQAYVIMPEIFDKIIKYPIKKDKIFGNSYGALREIEFFMDSKHRNYYAEKNNNFQVLRTDEYGAEIGYRLDTGQPYDVIHVITNQSSTREGGHIYYNHKHHLMEVVGNNIVLKTGSLNDGASSSWDNIRRVLAQIPSGKGSNHKPRYMTLGYGEMVYDFLEIKDYAISQLSFNLASTIIECNNSHMISSESILKKIKKDWKINEHNDGSGDDSDQLLNRIIPVEIATQKIDSYSTRLTKKWTLPIEVGKVQDHIDDARKQYISIAAEQIELLKKTTLNEIKHYFVGRDGVLDQCGIKPTISGINKLLVEGLFCIDVYSKEMSAELSGEGTGSIISLNKSKNDVESKIAKLKLADGESWWSHDKKVNIALANLIKSVDSQVLAEKEKIVREYAQDFFVDIESTLNEIKNNLLTFNNNMDLVKVGLQKDAKNYLDNINGQGKRPFTKNIALDYLSADLMTERRHISTLIGSKACLYDYVSMLPHYTGSGVANKNNLSENIKNSIIISDTIKELKNGSVTSYVEKLTNSEDPEALARVYKELDLMAQPLTDLDLDECKNKIKYWTPSKLWGVPGDAEHFKYSGNQDIEYSKTGNKYVLSAESLFFPARIDLFPNIMKYHSDYTDLNETVSCDTDKRVTLAMNKFRLSLSGEKNTQEKDLFTWSWGFVLYDLSAGIKGVFRKRGNKYKVFSPTLGDTTHNEFSLESQWRHEAYEYFRHNGKLSSELAKEIKKTLKAMSQEERINLVDSLINKDGSPPNTNYIDNYANPGRDSSDRGDPRSEATYRLLEKENTLMQNLTDEIMAEYTD